MAEVKEVKEVKEAKPVKEKKSAKEAKPVKEAVVAEVVAEEVESPWYYFFSQGCGWCKKSTPVVEGLIEEGNDILMLDLAEPDNQKLAQELKDEYKTQCGTPWFINADTGKGVCGFREKDMLDLWLKGEDIPEPPRPTGPPPKVPFHGSATKENTKWTADYTKWVKDNKHMPDDWQNRQKSASELIDSPRPKSDPPRPPMGPQMAQATDADFDKWGVEMQVWQDENKHLPNLQPVDRIVQNLKNRRNQAANAPQPGGAPNSPASFGNLEQRISAMEQKLDRLISHLGVK